MDRSARPHDAGAGGAAARPTLTGGITVFGERRRRRGRDERDGELRAHRDCSDAEGRAPVWADDEWDRVRIQLQSRSVGPLADESPSRGSSRRQRHWPPGSRRHRGIKAWRRIASGNETGRLLIQRAAPRRGCQREGEGDAEREHGIPGGPHPRRRRVARAHGDRPQDLVGPRRRDPPRHRSLGVVTDLERVGGPNAQIAIVG